MANIKDLLNQRFGFYKIIKFMGRDKFGASLWKGKCKCGRVKIATGVNFRKLKIKMCNKCQDKEKEKTRKAKLDKIEPLLYPKPKKLNIEIVTIAEVEKYRKINCIFYENCLDHATVFNWMNFSCIDCSHYFKEDEPDEMEEIKCQKLIHSL
jgi:hypothetical protein